MAVDYLDGDIYELTPSNVNAMLDHSNISMLNNNNDNNNLFLALVMKPNKKWKKIGSLKPNK